MRDAVRSVVQEQCELKVQESEPEVCAEVEEVVARAKPRMRMIREKLTRVPKKDKRPERMSRTLDTEHTRRMEEIAERKAQRGQLEARIEELRKSLGVVRELDKVAERKAELEGLELELERSRDEELQYLDATRDILSEYYSKNRRVRRVQLMNQYCGLLEDVIIARPSDSCVECEGYLEATPCGSTTTCTSCGMVNRVEYEMDQSKVKDATKKMSTYPYKRINHFIEWLNNITGNETTVIDDEVLLRVHQELRKRRILDRNDINRKVIRSVLKHLGLNKYYEHTSYIEYKLTDKPLPKITKEQKQVFVWMFKAIQEPFERHKPEGRKNFLSYSYVLHKFCELKMYDYLLGHFELLKNRKKLREQDKTWKLICKDVNWKFYPSC